MDMFNNAHGKSSTTKIYIYGMQKQGKMKKAIRFIDILVTQETYLLSSLKISVQFIWIINYIFVKFRLNNLVPKKPAQI
jgi:hypothetical protein